MIDAATLGSGLKLSAIAIPFLAIMSAAAFCYFARPILVPLVTAATFAYVLSPGVEFFVRHRVPRVLGVVIVLGAAMSVFGALGYVLVLQAQGLARALPGYWANLQTMLGSWQDWIAHLPPQLQALLPTAETDLWQQLDLKDLSMLPRTLFAGLGSVLSFLMWGVLVGFLTLFMLLDMPAMQNRLLRAMGREQEAVMRSTLAHINDQLRKYLAVKLATSAGLGIVATIGLLLLDVPYAYVWGPLAGFLNLIPYVGAIISAVPPVVIASVHAQSLWPGLWVALFMLVLQNIEGNLVTPKLIGDRVQLNVLAVLVATVVWGFLWGPIGVLLAIPITAAVKVVCGRIEPLVPIAELLG
jgi:predicted PurR-regulated permease PerM